MPRLSKAEQLAADLELLRSRPRLEVVGPAGEIRQVACGHVQVEHLQAMRWEARACGGRLVVLKRPGNNRSMTPSEAEKRRHGVFFEEGRAATLRRYERLRNVPGYRDGAGGGEATVDARCGQRQRKARG